MPDLFSELDAPQPAIEPRDPSVPRAARPRLSRQCQEILDMLRRGRATNARLAGISLKYTSRISDIRKWFHDTRQAGLEIRVIDQDHRTGVCTYGLFDHGKEVGQQFTN
jgi:hypothetical protein